MSGQRLKHALGADLRELRRARGLTQEQLAEELGVTTRYLAGIERGERNLSLDSIDALATRLGVMPTIALDSAQPVEGDPAM